MPCQAYFQLQRCKHNTCKWSLFISVKVIEIQMLRYILTVYRLSRIQKRKRVARIKLQISPFLALLDYVSRANEIEIRPSSVVRPSSVRLWHRLSLKLSRRFLSNFSCGFP